MVGFIRISLKLVLVSLLVFFLGACGSGATAGLEAFQSPDGRYGFFYPTGRTRIAVDGGPTVVYHDVINSDETLSLVVSEISSQIDLEGLGTPMEVGQKMMTDVIAPEGTGRDVELVSSEERNIEGHVFYDLEYSVHLSDRDRHELATVVIDKGSLYTLAASTNESRWPKVKSLFEKVIKSFTFFV